MMDPDSDRDHRRIERLLHAMRGAPLPAYADVAPRVMARVRMLGLPRRSTTPFSLGQFGLAAAVAVLFIGIGLLGFVGLIGPGAFSSPTSALASVHRAGGVLWSVAAGFARITVRAGISVAARLSGEIGGLDSSLSTAAQAAAWVFVLLFVATILVVTREVGTRRNAG
jgi:hypothetical protein